MADSGAQRLCFQWSLAQNPKIVTKMDAPSITSEFA
jgi:hypothetical protein